MGVLFDCLDTLGSLVAFHLVDVCIVAEVPVVGCVHLSLDQEVLWVSIHLVFNGVLLLVYLG